jgi:hypothetical protein
VGHAEGLSAVIETDWKRSCDDGFGTGGVEEEDAAWAEYLATWLIEQCLEILESAKASRNIGLANHALLTLARLGGFIECPPDPVLRAYSWIQRVQANEAAASARNAARLRSCGARRKRDGQLCTAKPLANGRCKFHGGMSTGPKTTEGRLRALANLRHLQSSRLPRADPDILATADSRTP